jgi:hypothetical protein
MEMKILIVITKTHQVEGLNFNLSQLGHYRIASTCTDAVTKYQTRHSEPQVRNMLDRVTSKDRTFYFTDVFDQISSS